MLEETASESSQTLIDLHMLLDAMESREYSVTKFKWAAGIFGLVFLYLSGKQIKSWLSSTTSEVTRQSMDDPEFRAKVKETATEVIIQIVEDEEIKDMVKNYVKDVTESTINSKRVMAKSKKTVKKLLRDSEIQQELGDSLRQAAIVGFLPSYFHPSSADRILNQRSRGNDIEDASHDGDEVYENSYDDYYH